MIDNLNSEAIFYGATFTTKSGWKATFQFPDQSLVDQLNAIGAGQRYMLVAVPIADDETPDVEAMQKPKRRLDDMPLSQVAGMMIAKNLEPLADFLCDVYPLEYQYADDSFPRDLHHHIDLTIKNVVGVNSKSEIMRGTPAGDKFEQLRTEYDAWRGKIARPE